MTAANRYSSPLAERYASAAMLELWSPAVRYGLWRQLWVALAEAERELGVPIPDDAIAQMRSHLDGIDFDAVAAYERRFRHDVMAHVHAFGDQAVAARPFIHLGATSAFVTDNADLVVMREGLRLVLGRLVALLGALDTFAIRYATVPCLAYTHFQPAQLTTVGKRAAMWATKVALDQGLDLNQANTRGETALHGAALRGADSIVQFLAAHGAKLDAKTKQGFTTLDIAMGKNSMAALPVPHDSTVALVRSLGGHEGKDLE